MSTKAERLAEYRKRNSPLAEIYPHLTVLKGEKGNDGKSGKTPVKGVDYFTPSEIESIAKDILRRFLNEKKGERGDPGRNGGMGLPGKEGKPGETPVKGTHYFTKADKVELVKELVKFIPGAPKVPTTEEIAEEVRKTIKYGDISEAPDLKDLPSLIAFLKVGGFRGGGSSSSSSTVYTETPSGLVNGVNTTYTVLHSIATVYSFGINGQMLHPTSDYTVSGTTITMVTALPVGLSGLPFTIIYS